jgi:hypothetical protein
MTSVEFGAIVRQKRKMARLSQIDLGLRLWKSSGASSPQKTISNIETGKGVASTRKIADVCRFLKILPIPEIENVKPQIQTAELFEPRMSQEDIALVVGNMCLKLYIEKKLSVMAKEECKKFRKAINSFD